MHLLVVALSFPSPGFPSRAPFLGEQVRILSDHVRRITVVSPTTYVPFWLGSINRFRRLAGLPRCFQMVPGRCEVLFPRYFKAPGILFPKWTLTQWRRIIDNTVQSFQESDPVSLIHAHTGSFSSWAGITTARKYGIPSVVTFHGSEVHTTLAERRKGWRLCRDSFCYADLCLPVSGDLERILKSSAEPRGRCMTMLLGVDQRRFFPPPEPIIVPRVLFVGRIERSKGVFDLLQAWATIKTQVSDAKLTMIGQDNTKGLFRKEAARLGVGSSIELLGSVAPTLIPDSLRQARVFCLPSYREGTPVSIMEALSCGLPVVATRVGGIPEIVRNGETGLLVDRGDVEGLGRALMVLLRENDRFLEMSRTVRVFAKEHLDAHRTAFELVRLYHDLVASSRTMERKA
jgi:teichuronic acid biosynthesis glycosyltransferase TuaC